MHPYYFECVILGVYRDLENMCMPSFVGAVWSTIIIIEETLEFDVGFAFLERM